MSRTVKVARIHEVGAPEVLKFEAMTLADPAPGQALVRNTVIGLNFVEVYYRRGTFGVPAFPAILGNEAAGVVEAVGPGVTSVKPGDRVVYGDDIHGSYTTARLYDAERLTVIPQGISDDQAAASFLKGLTARYLLKEVVPLKAGDTILVHAAAGGVGLILTQWASALGLHVIGTVSTGHKATLARAAGCEHVINYHTENFVERVIEITGGKGVRAVFDSVGKDTFLGSLKTLAIRGSLIVFGKASGDLPAIDPFELAPRALSLAWPILPHYVSTPQDLATAAADLFDAIKTGIIKVDPTRVYPFDELVQAHRDMEQRQTVGAVVLHV